MKPLKSALPAAQWLMRIAVALFISFLLYDSIQVIRLDKLMSVLRFTYVVSALLLVIGGFMAKSTLTIIAGVLLFLISGYFMFLGFTGVIDARFVAYLFPAAIGLYFVANGN